MNCYIYEYLDNLIIYRIYISSRLIPFVLHLFSNFHYAKKSSSHSLVSYRLIYQSFYIYMINSQVARYYWQPFVPIALAFVLCHPLEASRAVTHTHLSPYFIHTKVRCESMPSKGKKM